MMEVSEPIVIASAAGWYVGAICREDGFVQPYDRFTEYMTKEHAQKCLETPEEEGGSMRTMELFNESDKMKTFVRVTIIIWTLTFVGGLITGKSAFSQDCKYRQTIQVNR